jgi:hypothetical protein
MMWKLTALGALVAAVWVFAVVYSPMPATHAAIAWAGIAIGCGIARLVRWTADRAEAGGDEPLARGIRERSQRIALGLLGEAPEFPDQALLPDDCPHPASLQAVTLRALASLGLSGPRAAERVAAITRMEPAVVARMFDELGRRRWAVPVIAVPSVDASPMRTPRVSGAPEGTPLPEILASVDRATASIRRKHEAADAEAVAAFAREGEVFEAEQRGPRTQRARRMADDQGDETRFLEHPPGPRSGRVRVGGGEVHRVAPWARTTVCGVELAERAMKDGEGRAIGGGAIVYTLQLGEGVTCAACAAANTTAADRKVGAS